MRFIILVKFKIPNKTIKADTLPILWAWQNKNDFLFQPIEQSDSLWSKINKKACIEVGATEKNLPDKINLLVKTLTKNLIEMNVDSVYVQNFGFIVLL